MDFLVDCPNENCGRHIWFETEGSIEDGSIAKCECDKCGTQFSVTITLVTKIKPKEATP